MFPLGWDVRAVGLIKHGMGTVWGTGIAQRDGTVPARRMTAQCAPVVKQRPTAAGHWVGAGHSEFLLFPFPFHGGVILLSVSRIKRSHKI